MPDEQPDPRVEEMGRLYSEELLTMKEIGEQYGLSRQRVHQMLAPLKLKPHYGQRKRDERAEELGEAHRRIVAGESTTVEEAERLGYKSAAILRDTFSDMGLKQPPKDLPPHGTYARYASERDPCRCELCREASRERRRERYKRGPDVHGTVSAYQNFGCRCDECKQAMRDYRKRKREAIAA